MASVNKVILIGNLGKDPETRYMAKDDVELMNIRFWSKVNKGKKSECWTWSGAKKPTGYGNVRRNKKYTTAHRVAWELTFGQIPNGMQIQHSCDNRSCCNPSHLMLGTVMSNYIDMVKKNRSRSNHKNRKYGENNHNHKLTAAAVMDIRSSYASGKIKQRDLANKHGVSQVNISVIVRNAGRLNG